MGEPFELKNAKDGAHEVRWTSALRRPERSGDLETWVQGTLRYGKRKSSGFHLRISFSLRKMGLEVLNEVRALEKKGVLAPRLKLGTIWEQVSSSFFQQTC